MTSDGAQENERLSPWDQHRLQQMLDFRALTLRQKMAAIEELGTIFMRVQAMRKNGSFYCAEELKQPTD